MKTNTEHLRIVIHYRKLFVTLIVQFKLLSSSSYQNRLQPLATFSRGKCVNDVLERYCRENIILYAQQL